MNKLLIAIVLAAGSAAALGQVPPPPGAPVPQSEELATVPGVSAVHQAEIHKILIQRRNAQEDIHTKMRDQFDALHAKERSEHERVDEQASEQLRKLLGEDGYRAYAQWSLAHRGAAHGGLPHEHGQHPGRGMPDGPPAGAPGPGRAAPADDE